MKDNWISQGARLQMVISFLKKTYKQFANEINAHQSSVSLAISGGRGITTEWLTEIANHYEVDINWLLTGNGQMLKASENEPEKELEENFFPSNLTILMRAREMSPANLSSLIRTGTTHLTDLLEGRREPSISQLIRLRRELGVSIDDLLLEDLTQVSMDNLKEKIRENLQINAQLESILQKLEQLERRDQEKEEKIESIIQTVDAIKQSDNSNLKQ